MTESKGRNISERSHEWCVLWLPAITQLKMDTLCWTLYAPDKCA